MNALKKSRWPEGKDFAFTIFDDTDKETIENAKPVYDFLMDLGYRITKSVWPVNAHSNGMLGGSTCEEPEYRCWVQKLQAAGFEVGYHNATFETSPRETTIKAIETFKEMFGSYPISMANHARCGEAIYWGSSRLTGLNRGIYNMLTRFKNQGVFEGDVQSSPLFWGDVCKEKIKYVRNFIYPGINTLAECPWMPYHDPDRPFVRHWFASSDGHDIGGFVKLLSEKNQSSLEQEGGACIVYTHFANGFLNRGRLDPQFVSLMTRLSQRNGWFVPVGTLLDHLLASQGVHTISSRERRVLERRWLRHKVLVGGTN